MRFHDLLRIERLGLSVVHAGPDALDRAVTGAYITDLPDPSRFLSIGDVVLTSGVWLDEPRDADAFVSALVQQRVAALIVGLVHLGHIPDEILAACRREGLTLATISDKVSFKEVAEAVTMAQLGASDGLAAKGLRFNSRLAELVAGGASADAILRDFHTEFAINSWLMDDLGTLVGVAGTSPSSTDVGRIWNVLLTHDPAHGAAVVAPDGTTPGAPLSDGHTAWSIVGSNRSVVGYFVCEGNQRRLVRDTPIIVDGVIGALRVDLEFSARWREQSHSHVSELVRVLAGDSVSPGEISARMRLEGLDPQAPTRVVIAEVRDPRFPVGTVLEMCFRLFSRDGTRAIGCVVDDRACLLLNGEGAEDFDGNVAEIAVEDCLPRLGGRQLRIGVSDARIGVAQLSAAFASAGQRLDDLQRNDPVAVAASSELSTYRAVLSQLSERARTSFAHDVLRPVSEYDAKHGADLVSTLRVFLANNGAWQESARQLHLHTNTLRYRVARIEELTGRSLSGIDDRVDFFLALQITDA